MSNVVPLSYHVAFGVLCLSSLLAIYSANAKQAARPLAITTTVVNSCSLAVARTIPEKSVALIYSALMDTSELVRARCREGTVWRVEVNKSTSDGVMKSVEHSRSRTIMRLMINF